MSAGGFVDLLPVDAQPDELPPPRAGTNGATTPKPGVKPREHQSPKNIFSPEEGGTPLIPDCHLSRGFVPPRWGLGGC
jgi:hypothetical protein